MLLEMATVRLEERGTQVQVCFVFQFGIVEVLAFTIHNLMQAWGSKF